MEKDYTPHVIVLGIIAFVSFCGFMDSIKPPVASKHDREITVKYQDRLEQ